VKPTKTSGEKRSMPVANPAEESPLYGHFELAESALKQAVAQEERRSAQHGGKTIKRPERVMRTMQLL
jgi:hypothetical protein